MYFANGVQIGGTNYYYTRDHLGSIREVTGTNEVVQARYDYDPYGQQTLVSGTLTVDFGYTGLYIHQPSGLLFASYRPYIPPLGRWASRDPLAERGGINLYGYVLNDPVNYVDPLGLVNWGGVFGATSGIIANGLGIAGGIGLAVGTDGLGSVVAAAIVAKSGYGLGANLENLWNAINDQAPNNSGSMLGDIANAVAPCNKTAKTLANAGDLALDLAGMLTGDIATTPNMVDNLGNTILEGGIPLGQLWAGNANAGLVALGLLQTAQTVGSTYFPNLFPQQ